MEIWMIAGGNGVINRLDRVDLQARLPMTIV